jgi:hypothetical protein
MRFLMTPLPDSIRSRNGREANRAEELFGAFFSAQESETPVESALS